MDPKPFKAKDGSYHATIEEVKKQIKIILEKEKR